MNFGKLPKNALRGEFLQQLGDFRRVLSDKGRPKTVGKLAIGGAAFLDMARHYCSRINEGHAPSIKDTFAFMVENDKVC